MNELDNFDESFLQKIEEEQKLIEIENEEKEEIKIMRDSELLAIKSSWTSIDNIWAAYFDKNSKKIIKVKTKWLIENLINFDLDTSQFFLQDEEKDFGVVSNNNDRISSILNNWRKNKALDPPLIFEKNGNLTIIDGRHRLKTAILLKDKEIPIIINLNTELNEPKSN